MLRKMIRGSFMLGLILSLFFGAHPSGMAAEKRATQAKKYKMAVITKNVLNPFWATLGAGAKAAAGELGIEMEYFAPTKPDNVLEQITIMENLISKKVDTIILVAADSKGILPGIEKANKAGVPVMLCNTRVPGAQVLSYVGVDFRESAYRASKYTLEKMGGKGKIIHLTGVLGSQTGMDIKAGTEDAIKEYPGITVLATETAGFVRPKGMEVMENLLQRFPKIDAVLVANDASGLGVVEAIKQAGRMKDGMLVTGVLGGVDEGIIAVAKGEFLCVDYQAPYDEGYWATVLAYFALPGVSKNRLVMDLPSDVMIPCKLVTKDNVEVYMKKLGLSLTK